MVAAVEVTVTTANICALPLRMKPFVRRRMRRALRLLGATFGQEVARSSRWTWGGNYNDLWRLVATNHGKRTVGGPHEVPISLPADWPDHGHDSELVTHGRARISPDRFIDEDKTQVGDFLVAFVNCHPNSKPRAGVPASAWRIAAWNAYVARLAEKVAALHAEGYTVIFGGDMNKRTIAPIVAGQVLLVESGLDHLWCLPAKGVTVSVKSRSKVGTTVYFDHPILTATAVLRAA